MKNLLQRLFIAFALLLALTVCVSAVDGEVSETVDIMEEEAKNAAVAFLQDFTGNTYLYQTNDLEARTTAALSTTQRNAISLPAAAFQAITGTREYLNESNLVDNSEFLLEKAVFFKAVRQIQDISHEQFQAEYEIHSVKVNGSFAQVCVTEHKSFYYPGETMQSFLSDVFEVFLFRQGGTWYVFDMICDDGFDSTKRNTGFDAEAEIAGFTAAYENRGSGVSVSAKEQNSLSENAVLPMATYSGHTRSYNRDNAIYYAYTYSKTNSNDFLNYYNSNFFRIRTEDDFDYNADCMNFVSQCFYAGFYGSNDETSISNRRFPQDNIGSTADSRWYANPLYTHWSWTAIEDFNSYLSYCNSASSETGMSALQYTFPAATGSGSQGYTLSTPYSLRGVLAEVDGSGGNYSHAVLITTENGSDRNQLYYTAHTTDAKHILFSSTYPTCPVRIVIPVAVRELTQCSGGNAHTYSSVPSARGQDSTCSHCGYCKLYVKNNLKNCVEQGTTLTLSGSTSQTVYRLAMEVKAENSSTTTWLGEELCTSSYSRSFTFNQKGLYTITLHARDLDPTYYPNESTSVYCTFTIRVY